MRFLSTHKRGRKRLSRCRVAAFEVAAFEKVPTGLLKAIAAAFGILSLPGCIEQVDDAPDFSKSQCRRAPLIDVATGAPIIGAEDIALDPDSSRLIISAYDRRAVEQAARQRAFLLPEGGVYAVSLADLMTADGRLVGATPLIAPNQASGGLRPHGVDYDATLNEVVFVNRGYQKINGRWHMTPRVERLSLSGEAPDVAEDAPISAIDAPCSANDIVGAGKDTLVTYDHSLCGWRAMIEDVFNLKRSGIVRPDDSALLFKGLSYANGLARLSEHKYAIAATRENAIVFVEERLGIMAKGEKLQESVRVELPGGPDNLTMSADGDIIAALHPSLLWIGAHRKLGIERAPSRIVAIDPDNGKVSLLYEDLRGDQFSAATVGVRTGNMLIAGSVSEPGLLVCQTSQTLGEES